MLALVPVRTADTTVLTLVCRHDEIRKSTSAFRNGLGDTALVPLWLGMRVRSVGWE